MKTEEKALTYFFLCITILMLYFTFDLHRPGTKTIPLLVGAVSLVLTIVLSLMTIFPGFAAWYRRLEGRAAPALSSMTLSGDEDGEETGAEKTQRKELVVVGWLLFLTVATYFLGFLIAIPLFLFLFLKVWAKEGWGISLVMPVAVSAVVYFIFVYVLQIPLHAGTFFDFWY